MSEDARLGEGKSCFIISPIGNKLDPVGTPGRARYEESILLWEEVLEPACQVFGITPVRSDKISETGEIPDQIFTYLRDADLVIADLSHANPNVMYELGLRHSREGNVTIQIGEHGYLPFDITTIRTIQFSRTQSGLINLRNELTDSLRGALNGKGTPVRATEVFATARPIEAAAVEADARRSAETDDDFDAEQEPGIVELLAEGESATFHLSSVMESASEQMAEIGELVQKFGLDTQSSDAKGNGFAGRLLLARTLADDIVSPSNEIARLSDEFYSDVVRMDAMVAYIIERIRAGEEDPANVVSFLTSLRGLVSAADDSAVGLSAFRDGARTMRKASTALVPAANTLINAANRFLEGTTVVVNWGDDLSEILAGLNGLPEDKQ